MSVKTPMPKRVLWPFLLLAIVIVVLPRFVRSDYYMGILVFIGINTMLALGLNLLMGYTGQVSLGHAAFYGIGAYTTAILTTTLKWSPWMGLVAAILVSGLVAFVIGRPILKLKGHYLAMATLGFGMIVGIVFVQYSDLTGGTSGISGLPPFSIAGHELVDDRQYYYLVWAFALLVLWLSYNIVESRVGRALRAVHGSEVAAESMGVDTVKYKVQVFVLSAMFAGLAGALYAHSVRFVNPNPFDFRFSVELVVIVVIGGMASVWGSIAGATVITILDQALQGFQEGEVVVYGLILMLVLIYMPLGLTKTMVDLVARRRFAKDSAARAKES